MFVFVREAQVQCLEVYLVWTDFTKSILPQFPGFVQGCQIFMSVPI